MSWATWIAIAASLLFVLGPSLAHLRLLSPMAGFSVWVLAGVLAGLALIIGIVMGLSGRWGPALPAIGIAVLIMAAFFLLAVPSAGHPLINDVTTDPSHPPIFVKAQFLAPNADRNMAYPGESFARLQKESYAEIRPLLINLPADEVYHLVESKARQNPSWEITRANARHRAVEGTEESSLFRFRDDFIVEVREVAGGSAIHMRSKSRDGKGDMGINARRISRFLQSLSEELPELSRSSEE